MQAFSSSAPRQQPDPLAILVEASDIVTGYPLDLDELLRALAELVRKVVDYQLFAVLMKSGKDGLRIRYSIGYRKELVRNLRLKIGEGITGMAARQLKTIVVNDVTKEPNYIMAIDAVRSEIAVPLVARGKLVGLIDLQSPALNAFSDYERNLLELIGSRFSMAVDAAELHRATMEQNRTLQTLSEIAREFSHILNLEELLSKISSQVRDLIPYDAFSIYLVDEDSRLLKHYFGVRFDQRIQAQHMPWGTGIVGSAAELHRPIVVRDTRRDPRYVAALSGIRSEVAVPLMLKDQVIGVLDLESEKLAAFKGSHVQTLSLLAPQVATAIDNARLYERVAKNEARMERDLAAARELQRLLLPSVPSFEGIEIAARNNSAREVSGDLYDFFPFPNSHIGCLIGDVSGKGSAAALYASLVSGILRNQAQREQSPAALLDQVNRALLTRKVEAQYLTALYAQWHPNDQRLILASAGQPAPVFHRAGKAEFLPLTGYPLGMLDEADYHDLDLEVQPGDLLLAVSDGVTESGFPERPEYGDRRLLEFVAAHAQLSAAEFLEALFDDVRAYTADAPQDDDRTAVVIRVTA